MKHGAYYKDLVSGRRRGPAASLARMGLSLISIPYGAAVRGRNWLYDHGWKRTYKAPVHVVSIGNLTLGGTGKTPAVEYVARFYRGLDRRVAILSRGYAAQDGPNDEALVLEENLPDVPHLQGRDRALLARIAVEELESEILVLDDGFQHRRLCRNLDIVLVDATDAWGQGRLFPRGFLREPRSALKRADLVMLTRSDQTAPEHLARVTEEVARAAPGIDIVRAVHGPKRLVNPALPGEASLETLHGGRVAGFCGIGNPAAFRATLESLGCEVVGFEVFPDHHRYTREDVDWLRDWARRQPTDCVVVTTQKDLVKIRLPRLGERPLWAVQIALGITAGQEALDRQLKEVIT